MKKILLASLLLTPALGLGQQIRNLNFEDFTNRQIKTLGGQTRMKIQKATHELGCAEIDAWKRPQCYLSKEANAARRHLFESARKAVVGILVVVPIANIQDEEMQKLAQQLGPITKEKLKEQLAERFPLGIPVTSGSGCVIDFEKGPLIVTNAHVAEQAVKRSAKLYIKGHDEPFVYRHMPRTNDLVATIAASGRGGGEGIDLAFLKIPQTRKDGSPWPALKLGSSADLKVSDDVYALGYPLSMGLTLTQGIISAVDVEIGPSVTFSQTDAAINPGNSGGPLLNARGEVIGVNTMIISDSKVSSGVGFAMQMEDVQRALAQYARTGDIGSGRIGIAFANQGQEPTPVIASVVAGGPAEKAGLKAGDKVVKVDDRNLPADDPGLAVFQLQKIVKYKIPGNDKVPGDVVMLTVKRGDKILPPFPVTVAKEQPQDSSSITVP